MLPITSFAEEDGSLTNSSRVVQWKWKAADPFGELRTDVDILADLFLRLRKLYQDQGGAGAEPLLAVDWSYADPAAPTAEELLKELNGKALADVTGPDGDGDPQGRRAARQLRRDAGRRLHRRLPVDLHRRLRTEGQLRPAARQRAIRAASASIRTGRSPGRPTGASSTTAPRRIRAASRGARRRSTSGGTAGSRSGRGWTCRTTCATIPPDEDVGPFIMNPEGVSRVWARDDDGATGRSRRTTSRSKSPVANPMFPKIRGNPVARRVRQRPRGVRRRLGVPDRRHHLPADRALPLLDQERPDQRGAAAGALRRDVGGTGQGEGHQPRPDGSDLVATAAR